MGSSVCFRFILPTEIKQFIFNLDHYFFTLLKNIKNQFNSNVLIQFCFFKTLVSVEHRFLSQSYVEWERHKVKIR